MRLKRLSMFQYLNTMSCIRLKDKKSSGEKFGGLVKNLKKYFSVIPNLFRNLIFMIYFVL